MPRAYHDLPARPGTSIAIVIDGPAGGGWTQKREADRWTIDEGLSGDPAARVTMSDDTAWRLLFNGLSPDTARARVRIDGDVELGLPLLRARAIVI